MKNLTISDMDPALSRRIEQVARYQGISLNEAALYLLRKGSELDTSSIIAQNYPPWKIDQETQSGEVQTEEFPLIGNSLDHYFGQWTEEDQREFRRSLQKPKKIDPELWQ